MRASYDGVHCVPLMLCPQIMPFEDEAQKPYFSWLPPSGSLDRRLFLFLWVITCGQVYHELGQLAEALFRGINIRKLWHET
jgi:hypothetical protein